MLVVVVVVVVVVSASTDALGNVVRRAARCFSANKHSCNMHQRLDPSDPHGSPGAPQLLPGPRTHTRGPIGAQAQAGTQDGDLFADIGDAMKSLL